MTSTATVVWLEATERLRADPSFGRLVEQVGPVRLRPSRGDAFESLAAAIIYQQLAGSAALTIHRRFVAALGGEVSPERVLAAPDEVLRGAGLSGNKLAAIRAVYTIFFIICIIFVLMISRRFHGAFRSVRAVIHSSADYLKNRTYK
jgi:DNA-3-methyladenine glycosylase II